MGYTTEFMGSLSLSRELTEQERMHIDEWLQQPHGDDIGLPDRHHYSTIEIFDADDETVIISESSDGEAEVTVMKYLIENFFKPMEIIVNGELNATGSDASGDDIWSLIVSDNIVSTERNHIVGYSFLKKAHTIAEICLELLNEAKEEVETGIDEGIYVAEDNVENLQTMNERIEMVEKFLMMETK